MKQVAQTVKRLQRTHNLTKTEVADYIGISRRTVGRLIDSATNVVPSYTPSEDTAYKVAQFFGLGLEDANKRLPAFVIQSAI